MRTNTFLFLGLCLALTPVALLADESNAREGAGVRISQLEVRGQWILRQDGTAVGPESFRRGLQTSGFAVLGSSLLSVGDQRSQHPAALLVIDPKTARLTQSPIKIVAPVGGKNEAFSAYRKLPNPDFEGIAVAPTKKTAASAVTAGHFLYAITEDKTPWIATIEYQPKEGQAKLAALAELHCDLKPWRENTNFRFEGLAVSSDAKTLFLAYERTADDQPRILSVSTADLSRGRVTAKEISIDFAALPRRKGKERARLNLNGLQFVEGPKGKALLLGVARDQERVLVIDVESKRIRSVVDLELRSPTGKKMLWVSPEGITADATSIYIVNDPDSVRGNFRLLNEEKASGRFAEYAPLLFRIPLAKVLSP